MTYINDLVNHLSIMLCKCSHFELFRFLCSVFLEGLGSPHLKPSLFCCLFSFRLCVYFMPTHKKQNTIFPGIFSHFLRLSLSLSIIFILSVFLFLFSFVFVFSYPIIFFIGACRFQWAQDKSNFKNVYFKPLLLCFCIQHCLIMCYFRDLIIDVVSKQTTTQNTCCDYFSCDLKKGLNS